MSGGVTVYVYFCVSDTQRLSVGTDGKLFIDLELLAEYVCVGYI